MQTVFKLSILFLLLLLAQKSFGQFAKGQLVHQNSKDTVFPLLSFTIKYLLSVSPVKLT